MKAIGYRAAMTLRGAYLLLLLFCIATGRFNLAFAFSWPFLVTLAISYIARRDPDYHAVDCAFSILFIATLSFSILDLWPATTTPTSIDKLFHMTAGACLAVLAWALYRQDIKDRWLLSITILLFSLAIGSAWEFFEWTLSKMPPALFNPSTGYDDTMIDLIADLIGSGVIVLYAFLKHKE